MLDKAVHACMCCLIRDGSSSSMVQDHVGNNIMTSSQISVIDMMQVSCTDSDKSPTESSYDLPLSDSSLQASTVHVCIIIIIILCVDHGG